MDSVRLTTEGRAFIAEMLKKFDLAVERAAMADSNSFAELLDNRPARVILPGVYALAPFRVLKGWCTNRQLIQSPVKDLACALGHGDEAATYVAYLTRQWNHKPFMSEDRRQREMDLNTKDMVQNNGPRPLTGGWLIVRSACRRESAAYDDDEVLRYKRSSPLSRTC